MSKKRFVVYKKVPSEEWSCEKCCFVDYDGECNKRLSGIIIQDSFCGRSGIFKKVKSYTTYGRIPKKYIRK